MTDAKKANALLKAARAGDAARVREWLDAGVPIESTDPNRLTPVMLAAQGGHAEAFRLLVERGANQEVVGLGHSDLLGCAAEGGAVEIVVYLLERGHPVEGRWKPRSVAERRTGNLTPLMTAAINGRVDVLRVLITAGANPDARYDRETALEMVQAEIAHPVLPEPDRIERLRQVAAVLSSPPAGKA